MYTINAIKIKLYLRSLVSSGRKYYHDAYKLFTTKKLQYKRYTQSIIRPYL